MGKGERGVVSDTGLLLTRMLGRRRKRKKRAVMTVGGDILAFGGCQSRVVGGDEGGRDYRSESVRGAQAGSQRLAVGHELLV